MTIATRHVAPGGFQATSRTPKEVRGFMVHMAEGNNVAAYLGRKPTRNVSVQYVVEADGEVVSMVPELRVSGSLNPAALRDDTGVYYGRRHLDYVLGKAGARNPNRYVISVEVAGRAVNGPNPKQVEALVRLFRDCRKRYPNIKPLGHRDQQDVKPCPGGTRSMRAAFTAMGGHGADYKRPRPTPKPPTPAPPPMTDPTIAQLRADLAAANERIEALQAALAAISAITEGVEE